MRPGRRIGVVDIGATSIKSALLEEGRLLREGETPTPAQAGGRRVLERAGELLAALGPLDAIGVSTAGQTDPVRGRILYANENLPHYTGLCPKSLFQDRFGVPVAVENDANAAALGEAVHGAGRGFSDFLMLTFGTGIGGGIVLSGKVYGGAGFCAGEFGSMVTHAEDRRPGDPLSGAYERYASTSALVRRAQGLDPALTDGRKLFARLEEAPVRALVDAWLEEVLLGLLNLTYIFHPALLVLGGGVLAQPYVLAALQERLPERLMPSYRNVELRAAALGNRAGLLGAGEAARRLLESSPPLGATPPTPPRPAVR